MTFTYNGNVYEALHINNVYSKMFVTVNYTRELWDCICSDISNNGNAKIQLNDKTYSVYQAHCVVSQIECLVELISLEYI